jgi:hypothetical protein
MPHRWVGAYGIRSTSLRKGSEGVPLTKLLVRQRLLDSAIKILRLAIEFSAAPGKGQNTGILRSAQNDAP